MNCRGLSRNCPPELSAVRHHLPRRGRFESQRIARFEIGLIEGVGAPQRLPAMLFKVRAGALLSARTPDWCTGYLSGLLIGAEIGSQREWIDRRDLAIVGSAGLVDQRGRRLGESERRFDRRVGEALDRRERDRQPIACTIRVPATRLPLPQPAVSQRVTRRIYG